MRSPSAADLLTVWDAGHGRSPVERALLLLEAGWPESGRQALAALRIGERDARLLALRERVFGPALVSLSACPRCHEPLEQTFTANDIRVEDARDDREPLTVTVDGVTVEFRIPTSEDLAAMAHDEHVSVARARLIERCVVSVSGCLAPGALPEAAMHAVATHMTQADPRGDIQLALCCPACSREWVESFDIISFFWIELTALASRLVDQVHRLASAYGWREADILAMSPWRRELYLGRVGT